MYNRNIFLTFGLCGFLSLIFQFIGLLAPAWLVVDTDIIINSTHVSDNARWGLFWGYECADNGLGKECKRFSIENLYSSIQQSDRPEICKSETGIFIRNFLPIKILTLTACIGSIIAKIMMALYATSTGRTDKRCLGATGASIWLVSGILLGAAVAYYTSRLYTSSPDLEIFSTIPKYSDQMQQLVLLPWCIAMTGIGAFSAILTSFLVFKTLLPTNKYAGAWKTFRNLEESGGLVALEKSRI